MFNEIRTLNFPQIALPPLSAISSLMLPSIPPEPRFALSSLGGDRFPLSDTALGDLGMKLYVSRVCQMLVELIFCISRLIVLLRLNKLGIRFTSGKQQALLQGDTSGDVIHPFFVYGAQVWGMYFCDSMDNSPAMVRLQAKYLQITLELLAEISKGNDWELRAQVGVWITSGSLTLRRGDVTNLYIRKSCEAVEMARLQFVPTYGPPPEFSEELHEKLSVLSQIIYFENFSFLVNGGAEPTMTARVEKEFRSQLQVLPITLFSLTSLIRHPSVGGISGIIQDLSAGNAHASSVAGQRYSAHTQPSSDRR